MHLVDDFRDRTLALGLGRASAAAAARLGRPVRIMEVCGGHTHAIFRFGLTHLLPPEVELLHGPGCPVCVTPRARVEAAVSLARRPEITVATFGDMLRVPGGSGSLLEARAEGADVCMVYSALDALELARCRPRRQVVWFAIGFETTIPGHAAAVLRARAEHLPNFALLTSLVLLPPALRAILDAPDVQVDGFLGPGHVSTVIGTEPYRFIAEEHGKPVVICGFEPLDLLQAIHMILRQLQEGRPRVELQYRRAVPAGGNPRARALMEQVFEPVAQEWRGLGVIPESGLRLRDAFAAMDAERIYAEEMPPAIPDPAACRCGDVLRGAVKPPDCPAFGTACTPGHPLGACMVSAEGACSAYHRYRPAAAAAGPGGRGASRERAGGGAVP